MAGWRGRGKRSVSVSLVGVGLVVWICIMLAFAVSVSSTFVPVFFALAFGGPIALCVAIPRIARGRLARRLQADADEIAVSLSVHLPPLGLVLGRDDGMLCHEDGWLVYRGERTDWSVRAEDVDWGHAETLTLEYAAPDGSLRRAVLRPVGAAPKWRLTLERWTKARVPEGTSVLPPIEHDGHPYHRETVLLLGLILALAIWIAALLVFTKGASSSPPAALGLFVALPSWIFFVIVASVVIRAVLARTRTNEAERLS